MRSISMPRNPYLIFLPFLFIYIALVFMLGNGPLWGDETRHFEQAKNLLHGYYSDPAPRVELRNGPGYPILIVPFLALSIPLVYLKLMNAVMLYLAVVFLFKSLIQVASFRKSLVVSLFFACYYNTFDFIGLLYAEVFTVFLVTMLMYFLIKAFISGKKPFSNKYIYISGLILGYIALTKIIFGYVILCMTIGSGLLWLMNRKILNYQKGIAIVLISFATVTPYLIYTYSLTGRLFYWGTTGGNNLYWMASMPENEYGNWFPDPDQKGFELLKGDTSTLPGAVNLKSRSTDIPGTEDSLMAHHGKYFEEINKYQSVERDDAYKRVVYANIKANPVKFIKNCFSNIGRILFNYPYSYTPQKPATLLRLPLNGVILVFMVLCLVPALLNWRKIIYPVRYAMFIALLYLGGSVFGSAEIRMFSIVVPIILVWIALIIQRVVKVNWKFNGDQPPA